MWKNPLTSFLQVLCKKKCICIKSIHALNLRKQYVQKISSEALTSNQAPNLFPIAAFSIFINIIGMLLFFNNLLFKYV